MTSQSASPIERFSVLLQQAVDLDIENPGAMALATVDAEGRPATRTVLLKQVDERGFVFYTNLVSRKGDHLKVNPHASLLFYWRELGKQVSVDGPVVPVAEEEADAYFATRPRTAQLGAWASQQSRPLQHRAELLARVARFEAEFLGREVPRPPHWSGFRVVPERIEFWSAGRFRLHKREVYERDGESGWKVTLLNP